MEIDNLIIEEFQAQGVELREPNDHNNHILELRKDGHLIARCSQTGVQLENILKEIQAGKYEN